VIICTCVNLSGLNTKPTDNQLTLAGYSDADYGGSRNDRKSTTGNIFQIADNTICWRSVKQRCVSTSAVEAEYVTLSTTAKQQVWLQNALNELRIDIPAARVLIIIDSLTSPIIHASVTRAS